ncbi:DUF3793 family protein [Gordonibacter sp. Marseille-P4307]|uniref:DUF3793 family protein n=1 Tax=Gordonibacter sp. Marseille-P4307 TaxID=2161815 RepID=UPI000F53BD96|nr:DUF3793 family protein [Gordonibacter sp. Marseille-P4307]
MNGTKTLESMIVHHCAPVLGGIKSGGLFNVPFDAKASLAANESAFKGSKDVPGGSFSRSLREAQVKLAPLGVFVDILATRPFGALVYVYRPDMVVRTLRQTKPMRFLQSYGYPNTCSVKPHIERMRRRIAETDASTSCAHACRFPHEIGLFLGYPLEDVIGFIENQGRNCLACGCWKVYSNERDAQTCFGCFRSCTKQMRTLFREGVPIEELARLHIPVDARQARLKADESHASAR